MFDAYHKWLGILPKDQPPNHYRLLGVEAFESDLDVIEGAADRAMAFLRQYQSGEHAALAAKLLNEVATARLCLLKPKTKATYDAKLKLTTEKASEEDALSLAIADAEDLPTIKPKPAKKSRKKSTKPIDLRWVWKPASAIAGLLALWIIWTQLRSLNFPDIASLSSIASTASSPQPTNETKPPSEGQNASHTSVPTTDKPATSTTSPDGNERPMQETMPASTPEPASPMPKPAAGAPTKPAITVPVNGKSYFLVNVNSGRCLSIKGDHERMFTGPKPEKAGKSERWKVVSQDGYFKLVNVNSDKCLAVSGGDRKRGALIIQHQPKDLEFQKWEFIQVGDAFLIKSHFSDLVITVAEGSDKDGAKDDSQRIVQWEETEGQEQLWKFKTPPKQSPPKK